jgi:DHA2 family multidrug resistance protein
VTLKTWIAVGGALIGAFMAVLNIQITNASLPYIEGGIGTGGINGAWVITAYLIGEIIVVPMTDFLSRVFSLRRYLIQFPAWFRPLRLVLSVAAIAGDHAGVRFAAERPGHGLDRTAAAVAYPFRSLSDETL